jgi:hypothetical protein
MRSVEEYLRQAADFELLSSQSQYPALQKRFADLAACYRLLADERRRLIAEGVIANENGLPDPSGTSQPA